jgi:hypothetical protein
MGFSRILSNLFKTFVVHPPDAAMIANLQHARNFYSNPPTCFCIQVGSFYSLWETAYNEKGFWKKK